jgi:hypothetical protein
LRQIDFVKSEIELVDLEIAKRLFHNELSRRQQMMAQPRCMKASCMEGSRS